MSTNRNMKLLAGAVACLLLLAAVSAAQEQKANPLPEKLDLTGAKIVFSSRQFQSGINSSSGISGLARDISLYGTGDQSMGFAAKSDEAKTFLLGSFFSETMAYVKGGKSDLAIERLKAMEREFVVLGAPNSVYNFISTIENGIATKKYDTAVLLDMLGLFQPVCEDYLSSKGADFLTLFQAGSWLMDMGLAAAAKDVTLLKQPKTLDYFIAEMKRMDAPKGAQDALAEISAISAKPEIASRDAEEVLRLIKKVQTVLG